MYLAENVNNNNQGTGTLNVTAAVVTFNGNANLGSHNGPQNSNDPSNAATAVLNISNSGVVNVGGYVTFGGWNNNTNTSAAATITIDNSSQFNMTGYNNNLSVNSGTLSQVFTNTPTNGAFSLPAPRRGTMAPISGWQTR